MDGKKGPKDGAASNNKKSNSVTVIQRVADIQRWLLEGYTRHQILQFGSKWSVSDRQIDDYISQANALIKEINQTSIQENLAIITANFWDQYRTAKADKNGSLCVHILKELARIKGLDQTTVTHIIEDKRPTEDLTDDQLNELLEQGVNERH